MLSRSEGGGWDGKSMGDLGNMMRLFLELAAPAQRMEVHQRCRMWIKCSAYFCASKYAGFAGNGEKSYARSARGVIEVGCWCSLGETCNMMSTRAQ